MTPVSELLALKIENLTLKLSQIQTHANLLIKERDDLIEQGRKESDAPDGHLYNMDLRQFQAPHVPASTTQRQRKPVV